MFGIFIYLFSNLQHENSSLNENYQRPEYYFLIETTIYDEEEGFQMDRRSGGVDEARISGECTNGECERPDGGSMNRLEEIFRRVDREEQRTV